MEKKHNHSSINNDVGTTEVVLDLVKSISDAQGHPQVGEKTDITARQQEALRRMESLINSGANHLKVLHALLSSSDNWWTLQIVRPEDFKAQLLRAVNDGCLSPDDSESWEWLDLAARNNSPENFMDDIDLFYNTLYEAMVAGNPVARAILYDLWPPEQLFEED